MRQYDEPVDVREAVSAPDAEHCRPEAFVWRGRLYLVRAVLDHWCQRSAWWRSTPEADPDGRCPAVDGGPPVVDLEEEVWRVEAAPGRLLGTGVFDLARGSRWRLLRVAD